MCLYINASMCVNVSYPITWCYYPLTPFKVGFVNECNVCLSAQHRSAGARVVLDGFCRFHCARVHHHAASQFPRLYLFINYVLLLICLVYAQKLIPYVSSCMVSSVFDFSSKPFSPICIFYMYFDMLRLCCIQFCHQKYAHVVTSHDNSVV